MTYFELLALQQWCFFIGGVAAVVCLASLITWQAREVLDRLAARFDARKAKR